MEAQTRQPLGSPMVGALESVWQAIRDRHPEVPAAVVIVGAGSAGRQGGLKLGHFASLRWRHETAELPEMFVAGEGLQRGSVDVLGTLLHEAAHGLSDARGVNDTSRAGRYHNRQFAAVARELGLDVTVDGTRGWSATEVCKDTAAAYSGVVAMLGETLKAHRRPEFLAASSGRRSSNNPLPFSCRCPRRIRVAPAVMAQGPIVCAVCDAEFAPSGGDVAEAHCLAGRSPSGGIS